MKKTTQISVSIAIVLIMGILPSVSRAQTAGDDLKETITELRDERQKFKDAKAKEMSERKQSLEEKTQLKRQQLETRRAEAEKRREEHRKTVLLRLIDVQIKHLENTKARVGKMPNIDASLKTQLEAEIDKEVQKLNEEKAKVQNAGTPAELKALAEEIKGLFKSYRETVKKIVDAIHSSRLTNAIGKAEDRLSAIKAKLDELKNQGKDISGLQGNLDNAGEKISEARSNVTQDIAKAMQALKDAYKKFRDIADGAKNI